MDAHFDERPRCVEFLESYRRTPEICRRATDTPLAAGTTRRLWRVIRKQLALPVPSVRRHRPGNRKRRRTRMNSDPREIVTRPSFRYASNRLNAAQSYREEP